VSITDEYLDAADFRLTTSDYWLRIRDGQVELKEVHLPSPSFQALPGCVLCCCFLFSRMFLDESSDIDAVCSPSRCKTAPARAWTATLSSATLLPF
jgi:hypothetical protein